MSRYTVSSDAACAQVADGAVLLHLGNKRYYSLNETGAVVWQSLEEGRDVSDIVARLQWDYEVDQGEAERSVDRLLGELGDAGLIVSASE
jgi:hypothetical protein